MIGLRATPELRKAVETWAKRQDDKPGLSEAIRRLVELGLGSAQGIKPLGKRATAQSDTMAGAEIDRVHDSSATPEQRASRKRRLLKGPKEFRDMRAPKRGRT
jgi:hypothetical protein